MSKLMQVKKALEENPNIIIVDVLKENKLPGKDGRWGLGVNFIVAPKGDSVNTDKEL